MRGTRIEKEVQICATDLAKKKVHENQCIVILSIIHHRQNPLESTLFKYVTPFSQV
jgi:hypothetical protein